MCFLTKINLSTKYSCPVSNNILNCLAKRNEPENFTIYSATYSFILTLNIFPKQLVKADHTVVGCWHCRIFCLCPSRCRHYRRHSRCLPPPVAILLRQRIVIIVAATLTQDQVDHPKQEDKDDLHV